MLKTLHVPLEFKEVTEAGTFTGYASVFDTVDWYGDRVAKGAFKKNIADWRRKKAMPPLLWQHNSSQPIGVLTSMAEDDTGLYVDGKLLLQLTQGAEAHVLIKEKVIRGMSIGYMTRDDSYDQVDGIRTLKQVDVWEVSIATFPANEDALIDEVRSVLESGGLPTAKQFERVMREEFKFSRSMAKAITCGGLTQFLRQDAASSAQVQDIVAAIKALTP